MLFSTLFAATALVGSAVSKEILVAVGSRSGDLVFQPDSIQAAEGDTVTFRFWPKNHSVAQSTFAQPCAPMNNGFWSGFVPTTSTQQVANWTYTFEVKNASAPVWFYCTQGRHCQSGMVGVINPPRTGERTLAAYKNASASALNNTSPSSTAGFGGKLNENSTSGSGSSSSPGSPTPSPSTSGTPQSTGAAAHLAGSATFAGLTGLLAYLLV